MKGFDCPHCHEQGVSMHEKLRIGVLMWGRCSACGKKVGVSWAGIGLTVTPFIVATLLCIPLESPVSMVALSVAGIIGSVITRIWLVPLRKR